MYPFSDIEDADFHIDTDVGKVTLNDFQQLHVAVRSGHNIGFEPVGVTSLGQQLFGPGGVISIFIFQFLRPDLVWKTPAFHIPVG